MRVSRHHRRIVVAPELQELFEQEERDAEARDREREQTKAIEAAERDRRIVDAATSRVYDLPLHSYKLKEDLVGLARALKIIETGTNSNLTERIKKHLLDNPDLTDDPRFSGLFASRRQIRRAPSPPPQLQTFSMVAGPSSASTSTTQHPPSHEQLNYYSTTNYYPNYPYNSLPYYQYSS